MTGAQRPRPLSVTGIETGFDDAWHVKWYEQMEDGGGNIIAAMRMRMVELSDERCVMSMPIGPGVRQGTGVFAAGALIQLADVAATVIIMHALRRMTGEDDVPFPLSIQISANMLRNTDRGTVFSETRLVHPGKTMQVAESVVTDEADRVLAKVTTTHLLNRPLK